MSIPSVVTVPSPTVSVPAQKTPVTDIRTQLLVKQALQRWQPVSKDNTVFALKDTVAPTKPALDFVASPTKVGLLDWGKTMLMFGALPIALLKGLTWLAKTPLQSVPNWLHPPFEYLKTEMGTNGRALDMALMSAVVLGAVIKIPFSFIAGKAQHNTNEKILTQLQQAGVNAPLGNTLST
jgi:hypothetical protein